MVDVIKSLHIDYAAINPGATFRGLHESMVNHGGNNQPEVLTCLHEETAVAMGHGYAKIANKPLAVCCHDASDGPGGNRGQSQNARRFTG